jgi:uncharacterized cupin superfamily protein
MTLVLVTRRANGEEAVMTEATVEGGVPQTGGWFVLNARDARWTQDTMRTMCRFGGEGDAHFDDLGLALYWLEPGRAMSLYHHEAGQEDFLVLRGRCLLIVEGEERPLGEWDLVHCPPHTPHAILGAGHGPALVLAVGARKERGSARYPFDPVAASRSAGIEADGESPDGAYARWGEPRPVPAPL